VYGVLLGPGPDADGQNGQAQEPEDDVEAENDVLQAARDLGGIPPASSPLVLLLAMMRLRRHLGRVRVVLVSNWVESASGSTSSGHF